MSEDVLSTVCTELPLLSKNTRGRKGGEGERSRVWLEETDNNYTCPRRPREPDHVAMATQVQHKVTRKSIQTELIALLLISFHFHKRYKAPTTESHFNYGYVDTGLIRNKHNVVVFYSP